jgi:hypothetical protein
MTGIVFGGIAKRYPDTCIIFSHAGGTLPFLVERLVTGACTRSGGAAAVERPARGSTQFLLRHSASGDGGADVRLAADCTQVVGGRAFDGGAVMSRNQPVLVAPILGLSIPVPTYLGLGFTQPEAIGRINRYCDPKQQSQTATGFTALMGTADQSPAGATACQSDPHQHSHSQCFPSTEIPPERPGAL